MLMSLHTLRLLLAATSSTLAPRVAPDHTAWVWWIPLIAMLLDTAYRTPQSPASPDLFSPTPLGLSSEETQDTVPLPLLSPSTSVKLNSTCLASCLRKADQFYMFRFSLMDCDCLDSFLCWVLLGGNTTTVFCRSPSKLGKHFIHKLTAGTW